MSAIEPAALDAAWVSVDTPFGPAELAAFCRDLERLFRINPCLEFRYWRPCAQSGFEAAFRNASNGRDLALRIEPERLSEYELVVRYDLGLKKATRIRVEPGPAGSRLVITDDYSGAAAAGPVDTGDVDKSLHAWGAALHEYLKREARWGRYAAWRWYMRRVWLPMKPSARRITFIVLLVALAEVALTALVMAIYWAEHAR